MPRRRWFGMLALAASVTLGACAPTAPPRPNDAAILADHERLLDRSWERLHLPTGTARPGFAVPQFVDADTWWRAFRNCMTSINTEGYVTTVHDDGYDLVSTTGELLTVGQQVVFYRCLTRYVDVDSATIRLLTRRHLEYLWLYYERWVIPCFVVSGVEVSVRPTFEQFVQAHRRGRLWWPLDGVTEFDDADFRRLTAQCGGRYDALDRDHGIFP